MPADHQNRGITRQTGPAGKPGGFQRKTMLLCLLVLGLVIGSCSVLIIQAGSNHTQQLLIDRLTAQLHGTQVRNLDMTVINQTFRDLQYRLTAISAVLVLTLAGGILVIVRKVAKPIDEMGQAAELTAHLSLEVPDEESRMQFKKSMLAILNKLKD